MNLLIFSASEQKEKSIREKRPTEREVCRAVACTPGIGMSRMRVSYVSSEHGRLTRIRAIFPGQYPKELPLE